MEEKKEEEKTKEYEETKLSFSDFSNEKRLSTDFFLNRKSFDSESSDSSSSSSNRESISSNFLGKDSVDLYRRSFDGSIRGSIDSDLIRASYGSDFMRSSMSKRKAFDNYDPHYIEDIKKLILVLKNKITKVGDGRRFNSVHYRRSKEAKQLRNIYEEIRNLQFRLDFTYNTLSIKKGLIKNEIEIYKIQLKQQTDEISASKSREETLQRKLLQMEKHMTRQSKKQSRNSNKGEYTTSVTENEEDELIFEESENENDDAIFGSLLTDEMILGFLQARGTISQLENELETLVNQHTQVEIRLKDKEEKLAAQVKKFEEKINKKEAEMKNLKEKLAKNRSSLTVKEQKEYEEKIETIEKEIEKLELEREEEMVTMTSEIDDLKTKYEKVKMELKKKEKQLEQFSDFGKVRGSKEEKYPVGDVTIVLTDIQGSSQLWEHDIDAMSEAVHLHNLCIRKLISFHNGYEVKTEGDAFEVAFENPFDALNFVLQIQVSLMEVEWPEKIYELDFCKEIKDANNEGFITIWKGCRVRIGVHIGKPPKLSHEIDVVTGRCDYLGPELNRTKRFEGLACGGEILVSEVFWEKVEKLFSKTKVPAKMFELGVFGFEDEKETIRAIFPSHLVERRAGLEARKAKPLSISIPSIHSKEKKKNGEEGESEGEEGEGEGLSLDDLKPDLLRSGSSSSIGSVISDDDNDPEKKRFFQASADLYGKLFDEQIRFAQKSFGDNWKQIESGLKNPSKSNLTVEFLKEKRRKFCKLFDNFNASMHNVKDFFILKKREFDGDKLTELKNEYNRIKKINQLREKKRHVRARYLENTTTNKGKNVKSGGNSKNQVRENRKAKLKELSNIDFENGKSLPIIHHPHANEGEDGKEKDNQERIKKEEFMKKSKTMEDIRSYEGKLDSEEKKFGSFDELLKKKKKEGEDDEEEGEEIDIEEEEEELQSIFEDETKRKEKNRFELKRSSSDNGIISRNLKPSLKRGRSTASLTFDHLSSSPETNSYYSEEGDEDGLLDSKSLTNIFSESDVSIAQLSIPDDQKTEKDGN